MANKNIESVLLEERSFPPPPDFTARARIKPADLKALRQRAQADHVGFWSDLAARELTWHKPFTVRLDPSQAPNYRWFSDGELNASWNCLDVHLNERGHKTAIIFEGEPGDVRHLSYRELHAEVCRFANALKAEGIKRGDRVIIYMPMVPEIVVAMHACNRIGAIHSVVFGGFSTGALKERIEDTEAKLVITADGGWRGGQAVELKTAVDHALSSGCRSVRKVVVLKRTGKPVAMDAKRDRWWHYFIEGQPPSCEPEWVDAEHPLYLLYTSGSTGKPKGIQHSTAGYLLGAKLTTQWVFDLREDDVFWCTADVGWVTGHSYVCYGPLALGATVMMYEGGPVTPDGGRFWKNCQTHGVTVFYTAPTAIRALMKLGDALPGKYDLSRLRLLGTVGEPINPEAWMWYHRVIGRGRCPIVDTWWQTETGAILISPLPGATATKPGSCTEPLPGIDADIVDDHGASVRRVDAGGYLVIKQPWPSMLRTIWRDNARYIANYWEKFDGRYYVAGDSAHRDADGYFWIMGRIDDVLKVSGHRLGTMEIESALVSHPRVAEAAVVGKPHEIKGEAVFAYVICRGSKPSTEEAERLTEELRAWVGEQLSPIAKPDEIRFTEVLPKTRSGKIMRRLLRAVARGEEVTEDVSTLENPAILDQLRGIESPRSDSVQAEPATTARRSKGRRIARSAKSAKSVKGGRAAPRSGRGRSKARHAPSKSGASTRRSPKSRRVKPARAGGNTTARTRKAASRGGGRAKRVAAAAARGTGWRASRSRSRARPRSGR